MRRIFTRFVLWGVCLSLCTTGAMAQRPGGACDGVYGAHAPAAGFPHLCARAKAEAQARLLAGPPEGARGPLPSQEAYDVSYYDLDLYFQTGFQRKIVGTVTIRAEVVADSLLDVALDLSGNKTVDSVKVAGSPGTFTRVYPLVTVHLDRTYYQGEEFEVAVSYHGLASGGGLHSETRPTGLLIWSLSSVYDARTWWPCKDWPSDKADSVDIHVNVPSGLVVASNGSLVDWNDDGERAVYHWHEGHPIATYLVSLACHPYTVFSAWYHHGRDDSMEVRHHVFPDHYEAVAESVEVTVPAIEFFAQIFGEYPFVDEKYGHAEVNWSGGMEHQTCCSIGAWPEYLIVHELAHQWWGDMITCNSFHHIWLNEGFATYAEPLWWEHTQGMELYHIDMGYKAYYGAGTIYVEDPENEEIFIYELSYAKAAWVLHMLRHVVGDETFFHILNAYYSSYMQYGTATTEEFRDVVESVSGMELDQFFHQWIYEEYYPVYAREWSFEAGSRGYDITLTIDQVQTNHIFHMPIDVAVTTAAGETTLVVDNSLAHQEYVLTVNGEPTGLELDPDRWILRRVVEPLPEPTFDRGILLVNGVSFIFHGDEIRSAYEDSVFWGDHDISFWDVYQEVAPGYPATLPEPLGHGPVPADTLKQFSTLIWVSGGYGDQNRWAEVPVYSYLEAGGNVLLLTRQGSNLLNPVEKEYLGVDWQVETSFGGAISVYPGLIDMAGGHSYTNIIDTVLTHEESTLLFEAAGTVEARGAGAWRRPEDGGTYRTNGGQFVLICGRPYNWDHDDLRANAQYILGNLFEEPYDPASAVAHGAGEPPFALGRNRPNPFNPVTSISFQISERSQASLQVFDVTGRLVAILAEGVLEAGRHTVIWEGTDDAGRRVASGVYFYRLASGGREASRKMVLMQ